jgi:hypothetical protein
MLYNNDYYLPSKNIFALKEIFIRKQGVQDYSLKGQSHEKVGEIRA